MPTRTIPLPSLEYLEECFDADFQKGVLTWKERPPGHFKSKRAQNICNGRMVGKRAGTWSSFGYREIHLNGKHYREHRIIWKLAYRCDPPIILDHINCDKTDNRLANLRAITNSENIWSRAKVGRSNTSGYRGVTWDKRAKKWVAQIKKDGKPKHIGYFDTAKEAAKAAAWARLHAFGKFAGPTSDVNKLL